jgi:hypothetical protein
MFEPALEGTQPVADVVSVVVLVVVVLEKVFHVAILNDISRPVNYVPVCRLAT